MLSDFKDRQGLAYNLFLNDIQNNCVTHAYLIDENNFSESFDMILSFVKAILCENKNFDNSNCKVCSLCKRIDDGNYPEVKIIVPDGMYIKKQQILDLQQEFSRSSVEGNKRIYIIRDCEKMRTETANSMLKFLEEPEKGVVAILMTNNINNVLSTIVSRCKLIKLNNDNKINNNDDVLKDIAIDFVYKLENSYFDTFINIKDILFSKVAAKERDKIVIILDIVLDIYNDVMMLLMNNNNIKYSEYIDKIKEISKMNDLDKVIKKINIILEAKDSVKCNVNSSLLVDSIIVSIGGISDGSRY